MSMLGGLANAIGLGGNAAQAEQDRLAKMEYARQMMAAQPGQIVSSPYQQIMGGGSSATPSLLQQQYQAAQARMAQQAMVDEFNPNKHEAWTMPMSALVNLWRAKYLDEWVLVYADKLEPFWQQAWSRLSGANKFERSPGQWIRLREDA
jgi:hypothetical protein